MEAIKTESNRNKKEGFFQKLSLKQTGIIIVVLFVALVASGITMGVILHRQKTVNSVPLYGINGPVAEEEVEKNFDAICAPGFEMLEFRADTARQGFALYNPAENICYMKISIQLEDGTVLWTSRVTAPGESTDEIVLSPALKAGRYDGASIVYSCFRDAKCTEALNSAIVSLYLLAE